MRAAAPEPITLSLFGAGIGGLAGFVFAGRSRRRKSLL
jgi:hypothetical protein